MLISDSHILHMISHRGWITGPILKSKDFRIQNQNTGIGMEHYMKIYLNPKIGEINISVVANVTVNLGYLVLL